MRYKSTRGESPEVPFSEVLLGGLAPDGGLYMPEAFPKFSINEINSWSDLRFDQLVNRIRGNQELISWHQSICILEVIFGIIVISKLVYSPTECWLRCVQLPATTRQQVFNYQSVAKSLRVLTD